MSSGRSTIEFVVKPHKPAESGVPVGNAARFCSFPEVTRNAFKQASLSKPCIRYARLSREHFDYPTGLISFPTGYAVIACKFSVCFTHGNVLVPSGKSKPQKQQSPRISTRASFCMVRHQTNGSLGRGQVFCGSGIRWKIWRTPTSNYK